MESTNHSPPPPRDVRSVPVFCLVTWGAGRRDDFTCSDSGYGGSDGGGGRGRADFRECTIFEAIESIKRRKVLKKKGEGARVKTLRYENR